LKDREGFAVKTEYQEGAKAVKKAFSVKDHLAKHEYHEGPEALKRFERFASAILQAPKTVMKKQPKKKATGRTSSGRKKA
jgi:hypothetical protein